MCPEQFINVLSDNFPELKNHGISAALFSLCRTIESITVCFAQGDPEKYSGVNRLIWDSENGKGTVIHQYADVGESYNDVDSLQDIASSMKKLSFSVQDPIGVEFNLNK
jgi:hypothetical protein